MRFARLIPLIALMALSACSASAAQPSPTPSIIGIPTFAAPKGLLPGKSDPSAGPAPTMQPVTQDATRQVDTPDLGVQLTIPDDWLTMHIGDQTTILDANGNTMIVVGQTFGLSTDTDTMASQLNELLLKSGLKGADFDIRQSVVNANNYVIVSGTGINACEYAYLPIGLSSIGLKFERPVCDQDNRLNATAFAVLKSLNYSGPLQ